VGVDWLTWRSAIGRYCFSNPFYSKLCDVDLMDRERWGGGLTGDEGSRSPAAVGGPVVDDGDGSGNL
jgi:hypothetical protein